ncbi:MAG: M1 family metallopeptidase [Chitinophagaceae bacterium]|nr:M1 family metallopeptidase [Chitinophagaceae bacterium]
MELKLICCILFLFVVAKPAASQQQYWQQRVNNTISVTLNDKEHTLDGFIKIGYTNHSPDTLTYIWFHLWPNAYKNDRTAFSEQLLEMGNTHFYFSDASQKGYINQLDFRVNEVRVEIKDHPVHQDIVQLILPEALAPQQGITITTPFHIKLPDGFSGLGHDGQAYQLTQWYPRPAVYDHKGWHPMPYLAQGGQYGEFGNFDVRITLPGNYVVAATGQLQNAEEYEWLKTRANFTWQPVRERKKVRKGMYKIVRNNFPASAGSLKTLQYTAENIHDFAWFADKRSVVTMDTCLLASGKKINTYAYFLSSQKESWKNVHAYLKKSLRFYEDALGEYPYAVANIVQGFKNENNGKGYPAIAIVQATGNPELLEEAVSRKVGYNWTYAALAVNEREHAWMDEGLLSFYDQKRSGITNNHKPFYKKNVQAGWYKRVLLESVISVKRDQPVDLPVPEYSALNYSLSTGTKAALWMQLLEDHLTQPVFDSAMRYYYLNWKFKHPYPEDFRKTVDSISGKENDSVFALLSAEGSWTGNTPKKIRLAWIGSPDVTGKYHYIGIVPALGYNYYDQLMIGGLVHNYNLPFKPFQFVAAPLFATGSKRLNGIGRMSYTFYPGNIFHTIEAGISGAKFTGNVYTDSSGNSNYLGFYKIAPFVRFNFRNNDVHSMLKRYVQLKYYFIGEQSLLFDWNPVDQQTTYTVEPKSRYLGQVRFVTENYRVLYPYRWELQMESGKGFGRITCTGNYFFNYPKGGGMNVRGFAGKFFYTVNKSSPSGFETYPYHLNMTAPKGDEDYTYSNYFIGRNEYDGFLSQQVMMRDGGFKIRTDFLSNKIGRTDNWLLAVNFTSTIHPRLPVKLFLDAGTFSDAWESGSEQPRLLFDAGLQFSLLKDIVHIYVPVVYSKVYRDYFKSTPGNNFWQRISFSIDIQNIHYKKLHPLLPF